MVTPKDGNRISKIDMYVRQKVEYFSQKCVKKWRTYINNRDFRGFP